MSNGILTLNLPLDSVRQVALGAQDSAAEGFLRTLAEVLQLETSVKSADQCRAILAGEPFAGKTAMAYRKLLRKDHRLKVVPVAGTQPQREKESMQLRALLCGGVTLEMLENPGNFALMHGTLLEDPALGGIVLFGVSGIGKSTTRRRFIAEGGVSIADDALLLFAENGGVFARRLPTWSDWFANGSASRRYPVNEVIKVKTMLCLGRGKDIQEIVAITPAAFHGQLLGAMLLHCQSALHLLRRDEQQLLVSSCWNFVRQLDGFFPHRALLAHLDYPLRELLAKEGTE